MPEQKDRRSADAFKLGADVGQRQVRIVCMLRPGFLVESWQRTLIVARKDQAAIRKNAFRVDDVTEEFFDGPLSGFVSEVTFGLVYSANQANSRIELLFEETHNVGAGNFADVAVVVLRVVCRFRSDHSLCGHDSLLAGNAAKIRRGLFRN